MLPFKHDVNLWYRCECGCVHCVESRLVKYKYKIECYCGKILKITPINVGVNYTNKKIINSKLSPLEIMLRNTLKLQDYTINEINQMLRGVKMEGNLSEILKEVLSNVSV